MIELEVSLGFEIFLVGLKPVGVLLGPSLLPYGFTLL